MGGLRREGGCRRQGWPGAAERSGQPCQRVSHLQQHSGDSHPGALSGAEMGFEGGCNTAAPSPKGLPRDRTEGGQGGLLTLSAPLAAAAPCRSPPTSWSCTLAAARADERAGEAGAKGPWRQTWGSGTPSVSWCSGPLTSPVTDTEVRAPPTNSPSHFCSWRKGKGHQGLSLSCLIRPISEVNQGGKNSRDELYKGAERKGRGVDGALASTRTTPSGSGGWKKAGATETAAAEAAAAGTGKGRSGLLVLLICTAARGRLDGSNGGGPNSCSSSCHGCSCPPAKGSLCI